MRRTFVRLLACAGLLVAPLLYGCGDRSASVGSSPPGASATATATHTAAATSDWLRVAGGYDHTLALAKDGTLWAWGSGEVGELGLGNTETRLSPTRVGAARDWSTIASDVGSSFAIKKNGTLWAWGADWKGQLGLGDSKERNSPTQVGEANNRRLTMHVSGWSQPNCIPAEHRPRAVLAAPMGHRS